MRLLRYVGNTSWTDAMMSLSYYATLHGLGALDTLGTTVVLRFGWSSPQEASGEAEFKVVDIYIESRLET